MSRSEVEEKTFASDQGHYYWPDGRTAYEVPYKDKKRAGGFRPTRITDCRELGLYPSVTTIMKLMGKGDALSNWYKRQVAMAAYDLGAPGELEGRDEYVNHLLDQAEKNMTKQRDQGSRDHGEVEDYFRQLVLNEYSPVVGARYADSKAVEAVLSGFENMGIARQRIASEKSFASPMGYGGKIDVSGEDEPWVVDFKFVDRLEKKKDYVDKVAQGAAYLVGRYGIGGLKGRFANIFVETNTYCYEVREWTPEEIMHGWSVFETCFKLWKIINKYEPT